MTTSSCTVLGFAPSVKDTPPGLLAQTVIAVNRVPTVEGLAKHIDHLVIWDTRNIAMMMDAITALPDNATLWLKDIGTRDLPIDRPINWYSPTGNQPALERGGRMQLGLGGGVASTAVNLAYQLGFKSVWLHGVDYAGTRADGTTYPDGTLERMKEADAAFMRMIPIRTLWTSNFLNT